MTKPSLSATPATRRAKGSWTWVTTTYFAEGVPYTIVNSVADALFTVTGMSLSSLGLTTLFHLPWNLKFLWGPWVDQYETTRRWLVGTEIGLCVLLVGLTGLGGPDAPPWALAGVFMAVALVSATHDIAVDGFYLEALDEREQSRYVGYRAAAYRLAMLVISGPLLVVADALGWRAAWLMSLVVMVGMTVYHAVALPRPEVRRQPFVQLARGIVRPWMLGGGVLSGLLGWAVVRADLGMAAVWRETMASVPLVAAMPLPGWIGVGLLTVVMGLLAMLPWVQRWLAGREATYARSFVVFLAQPRVGALLAFVLLFRVGESFLQKMRWPFLHRELGLSLGAYGLANGTVGLVATFVATLLGGVFIARHGLARWIWPFILAQNGLNLLYAALALWPGRAELGLVPITVVVAVEHFGAGLGTAVFMVYLMRCCDKAHKAAHMALLTALMSVGYTLAGVASGALVEALGYGPYFALTFLATVPSMALVFVVPHLTKTP